MLGLTSACTTPANVEKAQTSSPQQGEKIRVVAAKKDIFAGAVIDADQVYEASATGNIAKIPANHLATLSDAVGKLAPKTVKAGQVLCSDDVFAPTQPKPDEKWLVSYSTQDLLSRVDTEVAIKGTLTNWIIGGDHKGNECAILSIDQLTYVRIGLPCEFSKSNYTVAQRHAAAEQRKTLLKEVGVNSVVIARGKLHRCETSSMRASRNYLLIDQGSLKITKSAW